MMKQQRRKLYFEDGTCYEGTAFGANGSKVCEIVFNTSMVGYQEILSDPSYTYQAVVMTYPLIGNYGMNADDYETEMPTLGAFIVGEYNDSPSNFRSEATLSEVMQRYGILGIAGVDTRKLTRSIRDKGSRKVLLCDADTTVDEALKILKTTEVPKDAVAKVSRKNIYTEFTSNAKCRVVAIDCGMKQNMVRSLSERGCNVIVVPYNLTAAEIVSLRPNGILISNGPGDPQDLPQLISTLRELRGKYPTFGICLGHQLLCLAYGAKTYKMKFGHRGGNHPVKNLLTGKIEITSQNHSYAVEADSLKNTLLTITHVNLLDNTIEGTCCSEEKVFSVQYHPESAPGPEDSGYLFDRFIEMMEEKNA